MPQLRLTVQTITPLLMYGADNKDDRVNKQIRAEPELRAPSFRGLLRYWLRAVIGAETQIESDVFERESTLFGSTDRGSTVQVRVQPLRSARVAGEQIVMPEQTRGYALRHKGFVPESQFRITLSTHPLADGKVFDTDGELLKALMLLTHFSGVGRRSRRGSGNLRVLEVKGEFDNNAAISAMTTLPKDAADLATHLTTMSRTISSKPIKGHPRFAIFAPDTAVVLVGQEAYDDHEDAFKALWSVSGPYHGEGGIFGDVRPRRASAIHMRVSATEAGYVAQQTILYSGTGQWGKMQDYILHCQAQGFKVVYGTEKDWK